MMIPRSHFTMLYTDDYFELKPRCNPTNFYSTIRLCEIRKYAWTLWNPSKDCRQSIDKAIKSRTKGKIQWKNYEKLHPSYVTSGITFFRSQVTFLIFPRKNGRTIFRSVIVNSFYVSEVIMSSISILVEIAMQQ